MPFPSYKALVGERQWRCRTLEETWTISRHCWWIVLPAIKNTDVNSLLNLLL